MNDINNCLTGVAQNSSVTLPGRLQRFLSFCSGHFCDHGYGDSIEFIWV